MNASDHSQVISRRTQRRGIHVGRPQRTAGASRRTRGFTLLEILIALVLGLMLLGALGVLFARTSGHQSELERSTRQLENARFATDLLAENLMHAGYYGEFDPDTLPVAVIHASPGPCTATVPGLGWVTPASPGGAEIPVAVQGIASNNTPACLTQRINGTEALTIRHADTGEATTTAAITDGNLYLQTSRCAIDDRRIRTGSVAADFTLRLPNCTAQHNAIRRLVQRTYYIASCNDCAANDGIPTLKRAEWVDGALRLTALAEGIENMQFEYGIDTDAVPDGRPNSFVAATAINGLAPNVWQNVVAVRVHLLARTTQPTAGYVDPRVYTLANISVTPADAFKRTLTTITVRLNNVGGRRER